MSDIVVISSGETRYSRKVVENLCRAGRPPTIVFLGSSAQAILFRLDSLRRIWRQLGALEVAKRIIRSYRTPAARDDASSNSIADLSRRYSFKIETYDKINQGSMIIRILMANHPITVLAGCGIIDKALISASIGGCLNGHPAILPGLRGVDVYEWAILKNAPFGVTAHLVEEKVDTGKVITQQHLAPALDEDFWGFHHRIQHAQAKILVEAVVKVHDGVAEFVKNETKKSELCRAMPDRLHKEARRKFTAS